MTARRPASEQNPAGLPPAVTELLTVIREALDVPIPDNPVDDQQRYKVLTQRAADARVVVELVLKHGDLGHYTARLREWTGEHPVTYRTWQDRIEQAAAEEQRLLDADAEAVRRSVDAQFPVIAAFLTQKRGEQR